MSRKVLFEDLGRIRYKKAWDYQEKLFAAVIRDKMEQKEDKNQYLLFCEHEPVYTLGKRGNRQNLLITRQMCESRQIDLHEIDRGGDITYHGPGQLVAYPIIDLEAFGFGIKRYISLLEDVVIETLKPYGIRGEKDEKAMGVWIDAADPARARKICAIGVRASHFVTM
ncbi:MAG: lipoyl(octanoyl) transferase LipB, partial [Proteiniphilum sp.]